MRVAVTGNMGSGKSTFASMLEERGGILVDADALARRAVDEDIQVRRDLAAAFGPDLLSENDHLDRRELARRALADAAGRLQLEGIVRPRLEPILMKALTTAQAHGAIAVLDVALVFEWDIDHWFDRIFVVKADLNKATARVVNSRSLSAAEVNERRAAQIKSHEYRGEVESVDNNGSLAELALKAEQVWMSLKSSVAKE